MERSASPPPPAQSRTTFTQNTAQDGCGARILRSVSLVSGCTRVIGVKQPIRVYDVPSLHNLPEALASYVLTFLTAKNICSSIRLVDQIWRQLSYDKGLWKELCMVMGKDSVMPDTLASWEEIYLANPHVPGDYSTLSFAVSVAQFHGGRVFVGAGEYCENLVLDKDSHFEATVRGKGRIYLTVKSSVTDTPCICIKDGKHYFSGMTVTHDSKGHDLWNGNSAVFIDGASSCATFENCTVTSATGRGVVAKNGSQVNLVDCLLLNSAATGIYVGGPSATGSALRCTVQGNGKGGLRVMKGHSGVFLDRSKFSVTACSVIDNHLSGISLVGPTASVIIEDCVVKGNASVAIDAPHDKIELRGKNEMVSSNEGPMIENS